MHWPQNVSATVYKTVVVDWEPGKCPRVFRVQLGPKNSDVLHGVWGSHCYKGNPNQWDLEVGLQANNPNVASSNLTPATIGTTRKIL